MSEIKRCPTCKRSKRKAIKEQVADGEGCTVKPQDCYFYNDIKVALEKKKNFKVIKKAKKQPIIKVVTKLKPKINIFKK